MIYNVLVSGVQQSDSVLRIHLVILFQILNFFFFWAVLHGTWDFSSMTRNSTHTASLEVKGKESEVTQSCQTLCDPMGYSLPGSSVHGIPQARILEWVAFSFSRGLFPTQGLNPGLLHCRQTLYPLSHRGSPGLYRLAESHPSHLLTVYP